MVKTPLQCMKLEYTQSINCFLMFFTGLATPADLNKHLSFNEATNMYQCDLCDKTCLQKGNLVKHLENIHFPNSFLHTCRYCEAQFNKKNLLYQHVSYYHRKEKASVVHYSI